MDLLVSLMLLPLTAALPLAWGSPVAEERRGCGRARVRTTVAEPTRAREAATELPESWKLSHDGGVESMLARIL